MHAPITHGGLTEKYDFRIRDADGNLVALVPIRTTFQEDVLMAEMYASEIVRAVNSHELMKRALHEAQIALYEAQSDYNNAALTDRHDAGSRMLDAYKKVVKALAIANGEEQLA